MFIFEILTNVVVLLGVVGFFRCDARLGIFGVDVHGGGCRAGETGMDSFSLLHTLCHNARLAPRLWDFSAGYLLKMKPQHG